LNTMDESERMAVLYFHPYEFHTGWLIPSRLAWRRILRSSNLRFTLSRILLHNFRTNILGQRLKLLLAQFDFSPLGDIYRATHGV
jgi:hypothetical protein